MASYVGFDVVLLAPSGRLGPAFVLGAVQRGGVLFDTLGLPVTSTAYARDRLILGDSPAWEIDLTPRAGLSGGRIYPCAASRPASR